MPSLVLPFGTAGLDRFSGEVVARPGSLRDARNVFVRGGRIEARSGMVVTATLPDQGGAACTHIPLLAPVRFERVAVAVGYYEATRELHLYRLTGEGESPTHIGLLFTLDAQAESPPRLHADEVGGRLFIAHDEPLQSRRAATYVYDPLGTSNLYALEASLSDAGQAPVRFRGVLAWHGYLVGWGFASATENRPEVVRVSLPGQPDSWDADHYFLAGTRGDPVLSVRPAGGHLLVRKASQTYRIHGSSHLDFGILPLHSLSGTLGHQLSIEIDGRLYDWSAEGPVLYTGVAEPGRLEEPLNLRGEQPEDFEGIDHTDGYVQYHVGLRVVEWVFGTRSFCLDLGSGQWSYGESSFSRASGALLYSGTSLADDLDEAPTGFPTNVAADPRATTATISWDNSGTDGNETAEVWLREDGGEWYLAAQVAVSGASQQATVGEDDPLVVGADYEAAVRFRRGGRYTPGYESSDPSEWPVSARTTFTTLLEAPTLDSLEWSRASSVSERIRVRFTPADSRVSHDVLRDGVAIVRLEPGIDFYDDYDITGETEHEYRVRAVAGIYESAPSNALTQWAGPEPPPSNATYTDTTVSCGGSGSNTLHNVSWSNGDASLETEILVAGASAGIADPGETIEVVCADPADPRISVRHRVEAFGVYDYTRAIFAVMEPT